MEWKLLMGVIWHINEGSFHPRPSGQPKVFPEIKADQPCKSILRFYVLWRVGEYFVDAASNCLVSVSITLLFALGYDSITVTTACWIQSFREWVSQLPIWCNSFDGSDFWLLWNTTDFLCTKTTIRLHPCVTVCPFCIGFCYTVQDKSFPAHS